MRSPLSSTSFWGLRPKASAATRMNMFVSLDILCACRLVTHLIRFIIISLSLIVFFNSPQLFSFLLRSTFGSMFLRSFLLISIHSPTRAVTYPCVPFCCRTEPPPLPGESRADADLQGRELLGRSFPLWVRKNPPFLFLLQHTFNNLFLILVSSFYFPL